MVNGSLLFPSQLSKAETPCWTALKGTQASISPQLLDRGLSFWEEQDGPSYFSSYSQLPGAEPRSQESGTEALPWTWLP